jgi:hypothetical protein
MIPQLINFLAPQSRPLAYLDPGSGSIIVQLLIAGLMAAGIFVKVFWKKIKAIFSRAPQEKEDDSQPNS